MKYNLNILVVRLSFLSTKNYRGTTRENFRKSERLSQDRGAKLDNTTKLGDIFKIFPLFYFNFLGLEEVQLSNFKVGNK